MHFFSRICTVLALLAPVLPSFANPVAQSDLWKAAERGQLAAIGAALKRGASVNAQDADGWTPLMYAASAGHLDAVQELVRRGANPNVRTTKGETPLMGAVIAGERAVVEALLSAGASPHFRAANGRSASEIAQNKGRADLVALIAKVEGTAAPGAAAPALRPTAPPKPAETDSENGVSPAIIKTFLSEEASLRSRATSLTGRSGQLQGQQAEARARETQAAQQRAAACQAQLNACNASCKSTGNGSMAAAMIGGVFGSKGSTAAAASAVMESAANADACIRNCSASITCESVQ